MNILVIGNGAREHAIVEALTDATVFAFVNANNPGIAKLCEGTKLGNMDDVNAIVNYAQEINADIVVVGPELPLSVGIVDALEKENIGCFGPTKELAQLETSKSFTRDLMKKYAVAGMPPYQTFSSTDGLRDYMQQLGEYVVKPDGLTGGKGVWVKGEHFDDHDTAYVYCEEILNKGSVVIEEKLNGEEFSLMSITDGKTLRHLPAVQDHKRAYENDSGPNTGGMGSYSDANHTLPFLEESHIQEAQQITEHMLAALEKETGKQYKGVMYGGFIATKNGVKLIEYNARFGDPEAMNVLPLLETPFSAICQAVVDGTLDKLPIISKNQATVCKYVVPSAYPEKSEPSKIHVPEMKGNVYYAAVNEDDGLYLTGSRSIGIVGIADTLEEAERIAEEGAQSVTGNVRHRRDIGTAALIEKRKQHMETL